MKTRQRILQIAISTFNEQGYYLPTLADIATACEMSRGNLAYHYRDKDAILDDIAHQLKCDIELIQDSRKDYPAFSNLSLDMRTFAILQERYPFIFRDTRVLEYQSIKDVISNWSVISIQRNLEAFAYALKVGNMNEEPYPGLYENLAINAWLITYYWLTQKTVRQVEDDDDAERMVWSTILPHFTEKGLTAFCNYYGRDYLQHLGTPFSNLNFEKTTINV